jgi:predicted outer membrane protein
VELTPSWGAAVLSALALLLPSLAPAQDKPTQRQIADAVSPLPDSLRPGAKVLGYRGGQLVTLRKGQNAMICLADDPHDKGFHSACYHRSLEPFMARGRALRAQGATREAVESTPLAEIEAGKLAMPTQPAALYQLFHDDDAFDPSGASSTGLRALYVIYMPYATTETTGISTTPSRDAPWLMYPGKPWAHVMLSGR